MLTRRELLSRGTTVLLLVPIIGCSTSSSTTNNPGSGTVCTGTSSLSSVDASHTHTVCVLTSDLANPPAAGVTYTTSNDGGHVHELTLSQAELATIDGGVAVTVMSTSDVDPTNKLAHTHHFSITKGTTAPPSDPGGGW